MNDRSLPTQLPTPELRERVEAELCEHFAAGHIELDELEQRLAVVDGATNVAELDGLVRELHPLAAATPTPVVVPAKRGWAASAT